ncbi:hypothetical protein BOTBODRAFT_107258 [Botryobasidium botryosum FD-172 SS1]|uniref:Prolyl 4-hydroxylase alpha subunit domain-containing protein n=1 Tax=Botryobasidium botryosum (strain FD-172 SS1) TaxID=930990 RepID=A0A067MLE3_BOTB1|nr:hypothetical protein BOTBODRAFT_107258 [Botryobasidium botryosum FD-172 SS1]
MPRKGSVKVSEIVSQPPAIKWPIITPKDYISSRVLEEDQIILIDEFLSAAECKQFSALIESLPLQATPPAKRGEAERVNHRMSVQDPAFAAMMYEAIAPHVASLPSFQKHLAPPAKPHSLNSNIRLYRYHPGQYFGPHYDDSVGDAAAGTWSEWTLLLYITGEEDGVVGGQTVFHKPMGKKKTEEIVPSLNRGTALLHR